MRCITSFIGKQLVLANTLNLNFSKSSILFLDISVPLDLQKMSYNLYVSKVVFATIISRSLVILLNSISFNEMVKAYIFKQRTNMRKVRPFSNLCFKSGKFMKNYCRLIFWKNLKKKETLCLSKKALIGSHPSSASRAHVGRFILVRIVILAAWYWRLSKKTILSSHVLPWGVVLNPIRHYQIQFDWNHCFPKFLIIPFNLLSILSFMWLPIC